MACTQAISNRHRDRSEFILRCILTTSMEKPNSVTADAETPNTVGKNNIRTSSHSSACSDSRPSSLHMVRSCWEPCSRPDPMYDVYQPVHRRKFPMEMKFYGFAPTFRCNTWSRTTVREKWNHFVEKTARCGRQHSGYYQSFKAHNDTGRNGSPWNRDDTRERLDDNQMANETRGMNALLTYFDVKYDQLHCKFWLLVNNFSR